jgi:hypothetical protein
MAVNRAILNLKIKACCFQHAASLIRAKPLLISPHIRKISFQCRRTNEMSFLKRFLPQYSQVGRYYEKAKERRGPSLRTWLSVGVGFMVGGAGIVVYLGEYVVYLWSLINCMFYYCIHITIIV